MRWNQPTSDVLGTITAALREHAPGTVEIYPEIRVYPTGDDPGNFIHFYAKHYQRDLPNVMGV